MNGAEQVLTAGVDAGSSSVKVVVARSRAGAEGEILATVVQRIRRRDPADVVVATFDEALAKARIEAADLRYVASTGDGDAVAARTGHFYSMTTHARGALHIEPEVRACLDVGALHARAIAFDERGRVVKQRMTSQCASGSGQFVENITRYLGVPLEDVGRLSLQSTEPRPTSSICAVLAETDVINLVSQNVPTPDILSGIHQSIAGRLMKLLRAIGCRGRVVVTGGGGCDEGLLERLRLAATEPGHEPLEIVAEPRSLFAGAIGAALLAAFRSDQLARRGDRLAVG